MLRQDAHGDQEPEPAKERERPALAKVLLAIQLPDDPQDARRAMHM